MPWLNCTFQHIRESHFKWNYGVTLWGDDGCQILPAGWRQQSPELCPQNCTKYRDITALIPWELELQLNGSEHCLHTQVSGASYVGGMGRLKRCGKPSYTFLPSFPAGCQDAFEIVGWKKNKNRENLEEEMELIKGRLRRLKRWLSTCCSCWGPRFNLSPHTTANSRLYLWFQGTSCPLLTSRTLHLVHIHTGKQTPTCIR